MIQNTYNALDTIASSIFLLKLPFNYGSRHFIPRFGLFCDSNEDWDARDVCVCVFPGLLYFQIVICISAKQTRGLKC